MHASTIRARIRSGTALAGALAILVLGAGGGAAAAVAEPEKAERYHADALRLQQRGDVRAALIQMRNAVQMDPENMGYRRLLGELALTVGDAPSAEKELSRAQAKLPDDRTEVLLGRALLMQNKADKVLETVRPSAADPTIRAEELLLVGSAELSMDNPAAARSSFEQVLALDPASVPAQLGLAQIDVAGGKLDIARDRVAAILAKDPRQMEALLLSAVLAERDQRLGDALAALEKARAIAPDDPRAGFASVQMLVRARRLVEAEGLARQLATKHPGNPGAQYALVLALAAAEKHGEADQVLRGIEDHLPAVPDMLMVAGLVKLQTAQQSQAERYLLRVLDLVPGNREARRVLADMHLRNGNTTGALMMLEPVRDRKDPVLLRLLASAYVREGRLDDASAVFEQLAGLGDGNAAQEAQASLALLALGREEGAGDDRAALLLRSADRMRSGDLDGALADVRDLRAKDPKEPLYADLEGRVLARQGDKAGAIRSFSAALDLRPDYTQALVALVQLYLDGKDVPGAAKAARAHVQEGGPRAAVILAGLLERQGETAEAATVLDKAIAAAPEAPEPRLALMDLQRRAGDKEAVARTARAMAPLLAKESALAGQAARAMAWAGAPDEALGLIERRTKAAPSDLEAHLTQARLLVATGKRDAALALLTAFDQRQSQQPAVLNALVDLNLAANNTTAASRIADSAKDPAVAASLRARILARAGDRTEAVATLETLAREQPSAKAAHDLYAARMTTGQRPAALSGLKEWLARDPADAEGRRLLAAHYQSEGDGRNAETEYRRLLALRPDDAVALNNLAWLRHEAKGDDALDLARQAQTLAPNAPAILDTLGVILLARGQREEALEHLRRAAELAPGAADIQMNYARALAQSGRRAEAAQILRASLQTAAAPQDGEVKRLLAEVEAR